MNRLLAAVTISLICSCAIFAQTAKGKISSKSTASANEKGGALDIQSGTRLAAQLESTLDTRKAKAGDQVVLKTSEAIKSRGKTVVKKGALLVGRVTDVQRRTGDSSESRVGLAFDHLQSGSLQFPVSATVTSISRAAAGAKLGDEGLSSDTTSSTAATVGSSRSGGSGGLLGGVTNTVGGVVDTTTRTTGSMVGDTTRTVGNAGDGLGRSLGSIHISESSSSSAEGGSILSLAGDDLRLEKGTTFQLLLKQSANADVGH
jgi:hypothetical protein